MAERKSSPSTVTSPATGATTGSAATEWNTTPAGTGAQRPAAGGSRSYIGGAPSGAQQHDNQQQASGIIDRVRERAAAQLSSQKDRATDGLGSVAQAVRQSTQQLRDQQHDTVAGYVEQAADQIDRLSRRLREKDIGELVNDAQRLARRQPALFVGSAFALGLIGARFFKSSTPDYQGRYDVYGRDQSRRYPDSYPGADYARQLPSSTSRATGTSGTMTPGQRSSNTERF